MIHTHDINSDFLFANCKRQTQTNPCQLPGKKWVMALTFIAHKITYHNMELQGHSKLP